ncbi:MAG: hypothetical protein AAFU56_10030, partial [Pseudomonadota bacterium]
MALCSTTNPRGWRSRNAEIGITITAPYTWAVLENTLGQLASLLLRNRRYCLRMSLPREHVRDDYPRPAI